jgi:hypothetical protein
MPSGLLELHWERDRWDGLHLVLLSVLENGQRSLVGKYEGGPFDGPSGPAGWLCRKLSEAEVAPVG